MKKNILTKLLALVLAIVMVLGSAVTALAEVSEVIYQAELLEAAEELYELFMQVQSYTEGLELGSIFSNTQGLAYLSLLDDEKEQELLQLEQEYYLQYLDSIAEANCPPAVNYANVAAFPKAAYFDSDITSRVFSLSNRAVDEDKLELFKKVTDLGNGTFQIELEAYTTGTVSVVTETKPCDIVLVLDMSTSMTSSFSSSSTSYDEVYSLDKNKTYYVKNGNTYDRVTWCSNCDEWTHGCGGWITHNPGDIYTPKASAEDSMGAQFYTLVTVAAQNRLEALKNAATTFIENVADQENNTMAIVGFHDYAVSLTNGFLDATTNEAALKAAINGIDRNDLDYATDHDDGLEAAEALFAGQTASTDRQRVVVMITDGEPEPMSSSSWSSSTVKDAITSAYNLKNTYKAALYTVSVMPGTDASNPTTNMDKYMNYMSSNYPSAQYTGTYTGTNEASIINAITPGTRADTDGASFYLTASDVATLNSIFEQITTQTGGSSVQLGSNTEIRDIVTPYFEVPAAGEVTVQTYDCTGYTNGVPTWSTEATTLNSADVVDVTGNNVTVTGFDFNHNFVSATGRVEGDPSKPGDFHGRKIKITFVTEPKDEFWGGNNVPTNGDTSGVYAAGAETATGLFDVPHVNVPLNVPVMTGNNVNIYLKSTEEIGVDELSNAEAFVVDPNAEWKTKFVVITPPSFVNSNQTISNTQDTENIEMQVVVAAKEPANATSVGTPVTQPVTKTAQGNVYVFKPVLTFADSAENYLSIPDNAADYYNKTNYQGVAWKHGDVLDTASEMTGAVPELIFEYVPALNSWMNTDSQVTSVNDVKVDVKVKISGEDVSEFCTSIRNPKACSECDVQNQEGLMSSKDIEFVVHILNVYGELIIEKTGLHAGESAIFTVNAVLANGTDTGLAQTYTIVLTGTGPANTVSAKLTGLLVGSNYEVVESGDWVWSYTVTSSNASGKINSLTDETATASFTNTKTEQWLYGEDSAVNAFDGK